MFTNPDLPGSHRGFAVVAAVLLALSSTGTVTMAASLGDAQPVELSQPQDNGVGPVEHVQAVPEVVEGYSIQTLAPAAVPTVLAFGPGDSDGQDLYAATLAGNVLRMHLTWTPLGPVVDDTTVAASGFDQPLGVAFDAEGDILVADSNSAGSTDRAAAADRPLGEIVHVDAGTGEQSTIVAGVPNGQHNINHIRFGPDGLLYAPNGNPNDHGNGTGTGHTDIFPYTGAFLAFDVDGVDATIPDTTPSDPAILHWTDSNGDRIADDDIVDHPRNQDFAEKTHVFAHGFRNIFGIAFAPSDLPFAGAAFTGMNGADAPSSQDAFYKIQPGEDHGFPFCYNVGTPGATGGNVSVEQAPDSPNPDRSCGDVPPADALLGWHTCATGLDLPSNGDGGPTTRGPVGFDFSFEGEFEQSAYVGECSQFFAADWRDKQTNGFSTHSNSHKVKRVALDENGETTEVRDFVKGLALPTDVQFGPDGAMYIADATAIYRVAPIPTSNAPTPQASAPVAAVGQSFLSPVTLVPAGTTVQWTSGPIPHTVTTADDPCVPHVDDGSCAPNDPNDADGDEDTFRKTVGGVGDQVSHRFDEVGVYPYFCEFHYQLGMTGVVVVVDPTNAAASSQALDQARTLLAENPELGAGHVDHGHVHEHSHAHAAGSGGLDGLLDPFS